MMMMLLWQVLFSSLSGFFLCLLVGQLSPGVAVLSLALGGALSWWLCRFLRPIEEQFRRFKNEQQSTFLHISHRNSREPALASEHPLRAAKIDRVLRRLAMSVSIFLGVYHFVFLFFKSSGVWWTGLSQNVGDLPMHIGFIRQLAGGSEFLPHNMELARDLLRYPLGADLYSAFFETLGVPTQIHLLLFGLFGFALSLFLLLEWGGWWMVCAFVFSGSLYDFLSPQVVEKAAFEPMWKNLLTYVFIPQRSMQLALPFGLWWLSRWWAFLHMRKPRATQDLHHSEVPLLPTLVFVASLGVMAFVHLHSFVILVVLALLLLLHLQKQDRLSSIGIGFLFLVSIVSLPFVIYSSNGGAAARIIHLSGAWWLGGKNDFWIGVLNFAPLVSAWLMALWWSRSHFFERGLMTSLFLLWIVSSLLILAPWDWDQIKILLWVYLVLSYLFYQWLRWQRPVLQLQLAIVLILSGVFAQFHELNHANKKAVLVAEVDLHRARQATSGLDRRGVFLAAPTFDHPLVFLGLKRMLGYEGHIWSHGLDAQPEQSILAQLKSHVHGEDKVAWIDEARRLGVRYLYWSKTEREFFGDLDLQEKARLTLVSQVDEVEIYEFK